MRLTKTECEVLGQARREAISIANNLGGLVYSVKEALNADNDKTVHVPGAKFPLLWEKEYYVARRVEEVIEVVCPACCSENCGYVVINYRDNTKHKHICPKCEGRGMVAVATGKRYKVEAYVLDHVTSPNKGQYRISFCGGVEMGRNLTVLGDGLPDMNPMYSGCSCVYETREEAQAEADRLNKELEAKHD